MADDASKKGEPERGMRLLDHINELRTRIIRIAIFVLFFFIFCFTFKLQPFQYNGLTLYYPFPDIYNNIASQFLNFLNATLMPDWVRIIQTTPGQAMISLIYVSLFLGIVTSMPVILYQLSAFISPGMYVTERKMIRRLLIPAGILFIAGCLFSYYFVTPFTLEFLYLFGTTIDAATFITPDGFISFVLMLLLGFGFAFQLPVIMYILTYANVIDDKFWIENFRYAVIALLFFAAFITPDGTGITMTLVAAPMIGLYLGGYGAARRLNRKRGKSKRELAKR